jgi:mannosyltransferase OCH1-like enzyme
MIAIPTFINSKQVKTPQRIPKTIIQTDNKNKIPQLIYDNLKQILEHNPEYDYRLITDEEAIVILKNNFDERTLAAFQQLKLGAAKGDFIRYIALFLYGGVYLDLDASINMNLNEIIDPQDEFIFFINGDRNLEQFCFAIRPRHSLMELIIKEMVNRLEKREPHIFLATGPILFNDVIYNSMSGRNIYNTNINITSDEKGECYGKNNRFMGGKIILRHGNDMEEKIIFYIPGSNKVMYDNEETISYSCGYDPITDVHYYYSLF